MNHSTYWLGIVIPAIMFCACSEENLSPEELPYTYEVVDEIYGEVYPKDLDGDQVDELILIRHPYEQHGRSLASVALLASDGTVLQQINYPGVFLTPHFYDWNEDDYIDIIVPNLRNDSLFMILIDVTRYNFPAFFLTKGEPRIKNGSVLAWDPVIRDIFFRDVNDDGNVDLITIICTAYARQPRGAFIHSIPQGNLLGFFLVGATLMNGFIDDFDKDGVWELLTHSIATNNGASAGGFSDAKSYVIDFELSLPPGVKWSESTGGSWSRSKMFFGDFDGKGKKVFLSSKYWLANYKKTTFEFVDPATWRKISERTFDGQIAIACLMDNNRDLIPEILASSATGELMVLDNKLEILQKEKVRMPPYNISPLPDITGDGLQEFIVRNREGRLILGSNFKTICLLPSHSPKIHPATLSEFFVRKGEQAPGIILNTGDKATIIRLKENPHYLFYRYGRPSLVFLAALSVLGLVIGFIAYRTRYRKLRSVQEVALQTDPRGIVLLSHDGRIQFHNTSFARMFELPEDKNLKGQKLADILELTEIATLLRKAAQHPTVRQSTKLALARNGNEQIISLELEPISLGLSQKPVWLLTFDNQTHEAEYLKARSWRTMSQRIAHDIKNSLSGILLTSQRLQSEYHDRVPSELRAALDAYTDRNLNQIENLRRVTRNFMKLVDLERPNLVMSNFTDFMQAECDRLKAELPPDVTLHTRLAAEKVEVRIDEEQIHELCKNLISNAVNAMPEGGSITISTQIERKLHLPQLSSEARDYVLVEVKDLGHGIPKEIIADIFNPKFTSSENGSGLGLAIVKKIVDIHSAHLEVESTPGLGTVFTIYFPLAKTSEV